MALLKLKIKINIFKEFQIVTPPYMDTLEIILSVCAHGCTRVVGCLCICWKIAQKKGLLIFFPDLDI